MQALENMHVYPAKSKHWTKKSLLLVIRKRDFYCFIIRSLGWYKLKWTAIQAFLREGGGKFDNVQDTSTIKQQSRATTAHGVILKCSSEWRMVTNETKTKQNLLKVIRCLCKRDCDSRKCTCKKHGLTCSFACNECKGVGNRRTVVHDLAHKLRTLSTMAH